MNNVRIFTTFEVSKMFSVDITSVIHWINEGKLHAYKTPGGHRRINISDLIEFADKYALPIDDEIRQLKTSVATDLKVLVVEDEPGVLKFVAETARLTLKNSLVDTAADGLEAGEKIAEMKPDILILDVRLTGIDGFEVLRRLRKRDMKILAISAFPSRETRDRLLASGADDFLPKPFSIEEIKTKILALAAGLKRPVR
ncbi:MAG: response regulator [Endomicrobiia bacterium]|nr:response regulator [Endomicrobiia bacterium]